MFFYHTVALILSATAIVSCTENRRDVVDIDAKAALPSMEVRDLDVWYSESGETRMLLQAHVLQRYLFAEEPYSVFPEGFFVRFYGPGKVLESQITADYALYKEKPAECWTAVGNVVVINYTKQQSLYTDTLYWDRSQHLIYTNAPVRIQTADGFFNGWNGMTSDELFANYELRNVGDSRYYFNDEAVQDSTAAADTIVATEGAGGAVMPAATAPGFNQSVDTNLIRVKPRAERRLQPRGRVRHDTASFQAQPSPLKLQ